MFQAIFCPSSEAYDWDFYSIWYPVVVVGRGSESGSVALRADRLHDDQYMIQQWTLVNMVFNLLVPLKTGFLD